MSTILNESHLVTLLSKHTIYIRELSFPSGTVIIKHRSYLIPSFTLEIWDLQQDNLYLMRKRETCVEEADEWILQCPRTGKPPLKSSAVTFVTALSHLILEGSIGFDKLWL